MNSQIQFVFMSAVISQVLADYHADYSGEASAYTNYNTYYPDYSYAHNNTLAAHKQHSRRIFTSDYAIGRFQISLVKIINFFFFSY